MKRKIFCLVIVVTLFSLLAPLCMADDPAAIREEGYTVSLNLTFSRKNPNSLQRAMSFLDYGYNGFATGFIVGDGLVMTAHHVVNGNLSISKRAMLGFGSKEQLDVKIYVNNCQAEVIKIDEHADLALLRVCQLPKQTRTLAFQTNLNKEEKLFLIARPHGSKKVKRGIFHGPYMSRGLEYWSARIDTRDGYSGSPVYNEKAELVGVLSSYDGQQKLAVISPGIRAQKLLEEYISSPKP